VLFISSVCDGWFFSNKMINFQITRIDSGGVRIIDHFSALLS
jgi:hypothetical protein